MTTKLAAAVAAGALAVGILVGAAGTVVVRDAVRPAVGMGDMAQMHEMMDGMGASMMDGTMPPASMDPADHAAHHGGDE